MPPFLVGGSAVPAGSSGVLAISIGDVGTGANTTETDLKSYTLPANAFSGAADLLRIKIWGTTADNDNVKTIRLKTQNADLTFGTFLVLDEALFGGHLNSIFWVFDLLMYGAATTASLLGQITTCDPTVHAAPKTSAGLGSGTIDGTSALIIKVTGQNGTAAANDIVASGLVVEYLSSPT